MITFIIGIVLLCLVWILVVLLGLGFVIVSLYLYLNIHFSTALVALTCGLIVLLVAISSVFLLKILSKNKASRTKAQLKSTTPNIFALIDKYFGVSILGLGVVKFLVDFSKEIRKTFVNRLVIALKSYANYVNKKTHPGKK